MVILFCRSLLILHLQIMFPVCGNLGIFFRTYRIFLAHKVIYMYVTVSAKTIPIGTFSNTRKTDLKY